MPTKKDDPEEFVFIGDDVSHKVLFKMLITQSYKTERAVEKMAEVLQQNMLESKDLKNAIARLDDSNKERKLDIAKAEVLAIKALDASDKIEGKVDGKIAKSNSNNRWFFALVSGFVFIVMANMNSKINDNAADIPESKLELIKEIGNLKDLMSRDMVSLKDLILMSKDKESKNAK